MGKTRYPGIYTRETRRGTVYDATASYGGKQRQSRGNATLKDARDWQRSQVELMRTGQYGTAPLRLTLAEFIETKWWPHALTQLKSASSVRSYRSHLRHVLGYCRCEKAVKKRHSVAEREKCPTWVKRMADAKIVSLTPLDIEGFKAQMAREGVGAAMQNAAFDRLREALNMAVVWEVLYRNPCDKVKAPAEPDYEAPSLSNEQVANLLKEADQTPYGALFYLTVMTGLRWGELTKLTWSSIDFTEGVLRIPRPNTKSDAGKRPIALGPITVARLRQHREAERARFAPPEGEAEGVVFIRRDTAMPDLVFSDSLGGALTQANFANRAWYPLREKVGLPSMHFHDLRHVQSTLLARAKVHPAVMKQRMGHKDSRITLEVYTDVNVGDQVEGALAIEVMVAAAGED